MFCPKCGTNNADTVKFCAGCGTPLSAAPVDPQPTYQQQAPSQEPTAYNQPPFQRTYGAAPPPPRDAAPGYEAAPAGHGRPAGTKTLDKSKIIKIAAAAAALIVLIVAIIFITKGCGGGSAGTTNYESIPKTAVDAVMQADSGKLLNLLPPSVVDAMLEESGMSRSSIEDLLDMSLGMMVSEMEDEYGGKIKYTVRVTDEYTYDSYDVEELEEEYAYVGLDLDITEAKELEVEMSIADESDYTEMVVIKVGGKWYLDMSSFDDMMG